MPAGTGDHSVQPGCVGTALAHWHRGTSTGTLTQCTGAAGGAARGVALAAQPGGQRPWPHRVTKTAPNPGLCGQTPSLQPRGGCLGCAAPQGWWRQARGCAQALPCRPRSGPCSRPRQCAARARQCLCRGASGPGQCLHTLAARCGRQFLQAWPRDGCCPLEQRWDS